MRNKDCMITRNTRTQCQYCRFQKCQVIGMTVKGPCRFSSNFSHALLVQKEQRSNKHHAWRIFSLRSLATFVKHRPAAFTSVNISMFSLSHSKSSFLGAITCEGCKVSFFSRENPRQIRIEHRASSGEASRREHRVGTSAWTMADVRSTCRREMPVDTVDSNGAFK